MSENESRIFGENGAILNADDMQPQKDWPKPEPQGMARKQWISLIIMVGVIICVTAANMIWKIF